MRAATLAIVPPPEPLEREAPLEELEDVVPTLSLPTLLRRRKKLVDLTVGFIVDVPVNRGLIGRIGWGGVGGGA